MALAPAPAAMDVDDEGAGGGARNQSSMVVAKSEAVCTNAGPPVVDPEPVEDVGGDTTECSSSIGDTCSGIQDAAGGGEPEVNSGMSARANGGRPWKSLVVRVAYEGALVSSIEIRQGACPKQETKRITSSKQSKRFSIRIYAEIRQGACPKQETKRTTSSKQSKRFSIRIYADSPWSWKQYHEEEKAEEA